MFFNCRIKNLGQTTVDDRVMESEDEDKEEDREDEDPAALGLQDAAGLNCLGEQVKHLWLKRKPLLDSDYAKAAWMLCVQPEVIADVALRGAGSVERLAMERVIEKLHHPPCPNKSKELRGKTMSWIVDLFWDEYKAFRDRSPPFHKPGRFLTNDAINGRSYIWHQKYSEPYTEVLGFVACRVCSKVLGIGMAERAWGDLKLVKGGRRSSMGSDSTEMRSVIYTSARLSRQYTKQEENNKIGINANNMFGDDDMK